MVCACMYSCVHACMCVHVCVALSSVALALTVTIRINNHINKRLSRKGILLKFTSIYQYVKQIICAYGVAVSTFDFHCSDGGLSCGHANEIS